MFESLRGRVAMGAIVVGEITPPGGVCGKIALACSYLAYLSRNELVQAYEGGWDEPRWERVVGRG